MFLAISLLIDIEVVSDYFFLFTIKNNMTENNFVHINLCANMTFSLRLNIRWNGHAEEIRNYSCFVLRDMTSFPYNMTLSDQLQQILLFIKL